MSKLSAIRERGKRISAWETAKIKAQREKARMHEVYLGTNNQLHAEVLNVYVPVCAHTHVCVCMHINMCACVLMGGIFECHSEAFSCCLQAVGKAERFWAVIQAGSSTARSMDLHQGDCSVMPFAFLIPICAPVFHNVPGDILFCWSQCHSGLL